MKYKRKYFSNINFGQLLLLYPGIGLAKKNSAGNIFIV